MHLLIISILKNINTRKEGVRVFRPIMLEIPCIIQRILLGVLLGLNILLS